MSWSPGSNLRSQSATSYSLFTFPPCTQPITRMHQVQVQAEAFATEWTCNGSWCKEVLDTCSLTKYSVHFIDSYALLPYLLLQHTPSTRWHKRQLKHTSIHVIMGWIDFGSSGSVYLVYKDRQPNAEYTIESLLEGSYYEGID